MSFVVSSQPNFININNNNITAEKLKPITDIGSPKNSEYELKAAASQFSF